MEHFQEHGMQEQSDGKHVIFVFPEEMHSLLTNISLPSQINSEDLQLARVSKIIRFQIFQVEKAFEFANKFPPNCQTDCVPYSLIFLISIGLYGPNLKNDVRYNDSQSCLKISQYIIFISKTTQCSSKNSSTRHSTTREPPLPLYIGLKVHSFIRGKKLIYKVHHLGISISYDRVIQIEKDAAYSLCMQSPSQ